MGDMYTYRVLFTC